MKILKSLVVASVIAISSSAFASKSIDDKSDDYYANYYEDKGSLLFKIRGFYASTNSKMSGLPAVTNTGVSKPSKLADNGYGFDTAMTIFVTDNIAAEVSLGLGFYKTKSSALSSVAAAYGGSNPALGKRNQVYMVPVTFTAQYHIAPFGAIRPYVGGGLNGTYMYTRSNAMKVSSGFGPVLQAGIDFIAKDDTLFTFDIRQYFLKSKVTFKKGFLGTNNDVKSKVAWNPLVISAGIGFKF
ncbi:MAG: OmpW family protein [Rickettsiaceae bacterium]